MDEPQTFVVILAGGSGTRLWPLSRSHRPKQLLTLAGDRSLLQNTVDRVLPLVPPERILVMTESSHGHGIRKQLPQLPAANVLVEPTRRGTAGSLALAAATIQGRDPNAVMASVHSDAFIDDGDEFRRTLSAAFCAADSTCHLVLMGIPPAFPSSQLGYIEAGETLCQVGEYAVRKVKRFVEKPELERARRFVASGRHFWNPGVFVWRVDVILDEFARLQPAIRERTAQIVPSIDGPDRERAMAEIYPRVPQETIDVGIMERSDRVAVIPARFRWSDIGSWGELLDILPHDQAGNVVRGTHLGLGTRDSLVFATSRPVATVGLENMIVVETPDAVLVCPRDRVQDVKKLVDRLGLDPERQDLL
ncbi:MAG TPA: mannose-1-phosphate guanylyltransferase [Chloroflexota bacterium]|nr:mannose-1-phosphate guanylyltransferase [Chloroflexota bacterium]